ncbi:uncharacterized protein LOC111635984 [Centruroides sculpturatus]|uniref:uncharacterized protein LOC111635984 n=1 Tax=Centruroides sculpturatus TaxID=218467 RepID=UPI000C6D3929|nr:uncharacterized protein LOC111635984 [Centruroides sculpturatus]
MLVTGILLYCSAACALPLVGSTTRTASLISHKSKTPGNPTTCSTDEDCNNLELLVCDLETHRCTCRDLHSIESPTGDCIKVKQLSQTCTYTSQCRFFDEHAICLDGLCTCMKGYYVQNNPNGSSCEGDGRVSYGSPTEVPHYRLDTNVIIIMVVMAIMFVGMCVALHLFSRARFRNRRTIFNSPHPRLMHIKLGKRRASTLSHRRHSHIPPPRSRHHSVSSHISHSSPSPGKTRKTSNGFLAIPNADGHHEAPLAENESLPSLEDLTKKVHEDQPVQNGPAILKDTAAVQEGTNSPTVIVTSASGEKTVVKGKSPSPTAQV